MFERILAIVIPVFGIAALGFFYARRRKPDMSAMNGILVDVLAPMLVFTSLAAKDFDITRYGWLIAGGVGVVIGSGILAYVVGKLMGFELKNLAPPVMFNNCGNMGLPLALLAFGQTGFNGAVALFAAMNILHYSLGVKIFSPQGDLRDIIKSPLAISMVLGVLFSYFHLSLPSSVFYGLEMMGKAAIPMMLFSLGARMAASNLSHIKMGLIGGILCPVSGILAAYVSGFFLPLSPQELSYLVLFGALPPAVLNVLMAEKYKADAAAVASIVVWGHAFSLVFVPLGLWLALY